MPEAMQSLNAEAQVILLLGHPDVGDSELDRCRSLISESDFDWGFFVDQAARHRVLAIIAKHFMTRGFLTHPKTASHIPYHWLYPSVYHGNRERYRAFSREFPVVMRGLIEAGVPHAIRKGPVLSDALYGDPGLRQMSDLDILIHRDDIPRLGAVLTELGYVQGDVSADGQSIEKFSRETYLFWRTNLNNDLPYVKLADHDHLISYDIDICLDIFQPMSEGQADVADLIRHRVPATLFGQESFTLSLEDQFVDICAHLHKEATALYYIEDETDLQLQKFLDVALYCRHISDRGHWPAVLERSRAHGAERLVYYAIHFASLLYPKAVPDEALDELRPDDVSYLEEFGAQDGTIQTWDIPFVERLFDHRHNRQVEGTSSIPWTT